MGLGDALGKETTAEIKLSDLARMLRSEERARILQNAIDAEVPNDIIQALISGQTPELRAYRETGLTPDKIREMDRLYLEKCEEVNKLQAQLAGMTAGKTAAENEAAAKAGEIEKLENELKTAWDNGHRMKEEQQNMIQELNRLRAQLEEKAAPAEGVTKPAGKEAKKKKTVKKPAAPKRKPLDMGKVRARRVAGWSLKEIGDEMGVSPQTIANALNRKEETEEEKDV